MSNVLFATRKAAVDVLSTVSAASTMLAAGTNSVAALAQTAEAFATDYRDSSIRQLKRSSEEQDEIDEQAALIRTATRLQSIAQQLKDPELSAIYDQLVAKKAATQLRAVA